MEIVMVQLLICGDRWEGGVYAKHVTWMFSCKWSATNHLNLL